MMTIDKTIEAIEALPKDAYLQAGTDLTLRCGNNLKALAAELKELREFVGAMSEMLMYAHRIQFPLPDKNGEYFSYFTSINRYLGNPTNSDYNKWQPGGVDDEVYDSPLDAFKSVMDEYGDRIRQSRHRH